jgi:aminoglycoside phosphotransferase (APT) family kinase protein
VLAELVCWINVHHRTAFRIGARYPDGEQGAYALVAGEGKASQSFVLKWQVGTELPAALTGVASLTERLRAVGYPAPRYRLVGLAADLGVVYSVQETLPGAPLGGRLDDAIVEQLLALNDRQRGRTEVASIDWPAALVRIALDGGDGFCLLEPMRTHSIATSDLLTVVQRSAAACADELAPVGDVVHFDFQGGNILIENGHITGVVDWEGSRTGDCAFDLATLFFCADGWADAVDPAAALRLWRALQARTTPGLRRLYLAHMIHRQVDWAIRFLGPALVERNLRRADQVLRLLAAEEGTARP